MEFVNPGVVPHVANETIFQRHLSKGLLAAPHMIMDVPKLFPTAMPITSFLSGKGFKVSLDKPESANYRVVGNRKIMFAYEGLKRRKGTIVSSSYDNATQPGLNGGVITIDIDTNIFAPYDVVVMADQRTVLHNVDDMLPREISDGVFRYYFKLPRSDKYITDTTLLNAGQEIVYSHNAQYEASETGYEQYFFDQWAESYLTTMRLKWSASGEALQTDTTRYWIKGANGQFAWIDEAERIMLERWAYIVESMIINGQSTVFDNQVLLHDLKGREIVAGDGILHSGDGSLRFPIVKLTEKHFENIMSNMVIRGDENGNKSVLCAFAKHAMIQWQNLMKEFGVQINSDKLIEGEGSKKGVNTTFTFYEFNGVRFYPRLSDSMSDPGSNPTNRKTHLGTPKSGHRGIFMSLGQNRGNRMLELVSLGNRKMLMGTIPGINEGEKAVSSVDATHRHVLGQIGVLKKDPYGVAEIFYP